MSKGGTPSPDRILAAIAKAQMDEYLARYIPAPNRKPKAVIRCPSCGAPAEPGQLKCSYCGTWRS